jgi:hypothetical protein
MKLTSELSPICEMDDVTTKYESSTYLMQCIQPYDKHGFNGTE